MNNKAYTTMTREELATELKSVQALYNEYGKLGLSLDLTRGKPAKEQLDLSNAMMDCCIATDYTMDGVDVRNYGILGGLPSTKTLFADVLNVKTEQVFVGGNGSLALMYDVIAKAYTHGMLRSPRPWAREDKIKFLCPCPGYDRHFQLSASFGMELIPIRLNQDGPDMAEVLKYVKDPAVKGMWCVPKFSNPDGITYSHDICHQLAAMSTAAPDFTIIWDNAYCVHAIYNDESIPNILDVAEQCNNPNRFYEFASTSKITFAGSGVAVFATSTNNMAHYTNLAKYQTISYSKVNEFIHVKFLKDKNGMIEHMKKHAAILRPKFDAVLNALDRQIAPLDIAKWTRPNGGYFVSLYAMNDTASRIVELCKNAGLKLTPAGATYPYGKDPYDSNIRIAPSYSTLKDVQQGVELLCVCIRLAALEKLTAG